MKTPDKKTIEKVLDGVSTKQQAKEVVNWFADKEEGRSYLSAIFDHDAEQIERDKLSFSDTPFTRSKIVYEEIMQKIKIRRIRRNWLRVAAIIIPLFLIAGLTFYTNTQVNLFDNGKYAEIYVPKGEQRQIIFQDGSEVHLNSGTRLKYPTKFGIKNRTVFIDGEGYFNISKNKKRPFVVRMNNTNIEVLGTKFNAKAYQEDNNMKISLDEGSIVFNIPENSYKLVPGQQIIYDKNTGRCTIYASKNLSNESMWKKKILVFANTPLSEVLKTLNRQFDVVFNIKDQQTITYTYTLTTSHTTLEGIIDELEKIAPVRFDVQKDKIDVFLK